MSVRYEQKKNLYFQEYLCQISEESELFSERSYMIVDWNHEELPIIMNMEAPKALIL